MEITKSQKTALLFGASGLIGGHCLRQLLAHEAYGEVRVFARRADFAAHPKLKVYQFDFEAMEAHRADIRGNDVFIALGTTARKAGGKAGFYRVDFTYCYEAARLALENGASQLMLVTSVEADPASPLFYFRVKGELEQAVQSLPYWGIRIFQPSLLLGKRDEFRWSEALVGGVGMVLGRLLGDRMAKYRPIDGAVVARAMIEAAQQLEGGIQVYDNARLQAFASRQQAVRPR